MKETFVSLILERLTRDQSLLATQFNQKHSIDVARHVVVDDLLPADLAHQLVSVFPAAKKMRLLHSYGEIKMKYCAVKNTDALLQALHQAIQDPRVVACVENITGILHQLPDCSKQAGGVSTLLKGHYLNPHLDNSHNLNKTQYRVVNLLYYISPNWKIENGGNYELWNESVTERMVLPCLFNRLVIMETNGRSWHAVNPVLVNEPRRCVFNYYFSEHSPTGEPYFFGASSIFFNPLFRARPEQRIRRALGRVRRMVFGK